MNLKKHLPKIGIAFAILASALAMLATQGPTPIETYLIKANAAQDEAEATQE